MTPPADPERYKNHRFPGEIISHGVWLYYRFPLSYRDVEELLLGLNIAKLSYGATNGNNQSLQAFSPIPEVNFAENGAWDLLYGSFENHVLIKSGLSKLS